ncbi:hypothetical protein ECC02_006109 [Trypanosoma cruzi]|uniref:Uncharacterized protein n=1 Tax=Trypanosoma cruzi TaxID=5693 RepID=A0A7J6Y228_TRYCR|nr:hypothetical protein ECC02_006109 [Trypanosoma cruzi]
MAPSQGNPDAVNKTQEPRQTTWQRYDRQPSSASERRWRWWCGSGVESSPAPSSQSVFSRSRESALHSRQRHHARTAYTTKGKKKHGGSTWSRGKGSTPIVHSEWLTEVRMVVMQMPRGGCDCSGLRGRREGTETQCGPHPPRLTVTPVTSSRQIACSKDRRRQRRSVNSLSHWSATPPTQPLAPSPTSTTREQRQKMPHARQGRCRRVSQLPKKKKKTLLDVVVPTYSRTVWVVLSNRNAQLQIKHATAGIRSASPCSSW